MEPEHDELIRMREKNAKLAKEVQDLQLAKEKLLKEKIEAQRDNNALRLKNDRLNHKVHKQLEKLDKLDKLALNNNVQLSGHITRSMGLRQIHKQECQDLLSYRSYGGSPRRVGRVPPQRFMGQCIQPVVSLSRTQLNLHATSNQEAVMDESHQEEMDQSNLSDSQLEQSPGSIKEVQNLLPGIGPFLGANSDSSVQTDTS